MKLKTETRWDFVSPAFCVTPQAPWGFILRLQSSTSAQRLLVSYSAAFYLLYGEKNSVPEEAAPL